MKNQFSFSFMSRKKLRKFLMASVFLFWAFGSSQAQVPFISVKQATTLIPTATGTHNFGNIPINTNSGMTTFTVENLGNAPLELSNFQITGANASMFTTTNFITTTVNGGANTTFGLQFAPTSGGAKTAFITIGNNALFNPVPNSFRNKNTANGLGDNYINGVYAVGTTVYVATDDGALSPGFDSGGLYISTDGGVTFTNKTTANSGLGSNNVASVYAVGTTVYAATIIGLSISTDGGTTFTNKTTANGLGNNFLVDVYVDGTTVYAATFGGLSISTDGGTTFINKTTANGLGHNNVYGVYAVGTTVYAATNGGLSISTDGGATFTNKTTANGLGNNNVRGVSAVGTTVYVATSGGLSISTDGGTTFINKTTANGLGSNAVYGVYAVGTTVYAGTFAGLSISTDNGNSFVNRTAANGLGNGASVRNVYASGTTVYAATNGGGLSISQADPCGPTNIKKSYKKTLILTLKSRFFAFLGLCKDWKNTKTVIFEKYNFFKTNVNFFALSIIACFFRLF